jgi:hypothetical protein
MNLTGKLDVDGLLKEWPAPSTRDDAAWEERADLTVEAAVARRHKDGEALDALLDAPPLAPEPGEGVVDAEPRPATAAAKTYLRALPGGEERTMSQGSDDQDGGRKSVTSVPPERKRQSLKEIAARASQSGMSAPPPSRAGALSTPLPSPLSTPLPSRPGSMPPVRASEAGKEDSGIIDLKVVNAAATPQQKAAAAKAQPGTAALDFDEGGKGDAAPPSENAKTQRRPATLPAAPQQKKGGLVAGVVIAVVGLAAAIAIMQTRKPAETEQPVAQQEAPAVAPEQPQPGEAAPAAPATGAPVAEAPPAEQAAADQAKPAEDSRVAAGPAGAGVGAAPPSSPTGAPAAEAPVAAQGKLPAAAAPPPGKPGDLSTAMQNAVGNEGEKPGATEAPEPAAGKPKNQNIPEQPSQGSVQAAVGSVMGGAKACVAGADDVSRAQITFSSAGSVSNVSVTGWAASSGASSCVKSALKGANVGPFSKSSFSVGVTIRP